MVARLMLIAFLTAGCGGMSSDDDASRPDSSVEASSDGTASIEAASDATPSNDAGTDAIDCSIPPDASCNAKLSGCSNFGTFTPPNDWACLCGVSCTEYCQLNNNGLKLVQCVYGADAGDKSDAAFFQCECHQA